MPRTWVCGGAYTFSIVFPRRGLSMLHELMGPHRSRLYVARFSNLTIDDATPTMGFWMPAAMRFLLSVMTHPQIHTPLWHQIAISALPSCPTCHLRLNNGFRRLKCETVE